MVKRLMFMVALMVAFLTVFAVGSFLHPFSLTQTLAARGLAVHVFVWDGVLLMLALYALALAAAAAGKRWRDLAPWTTGSLLGAAVLGYLLRLGFITKEF